jgi:type I restriction enzyme M protein
VCSRGSTTLPAISIDTLVKLPVILPDLATQQEIADVMTRLEEHEQALRRQLELAGEIRRDALNGLLTGRTS